MKNKIFVLLAVISVLVLFAVPALAEDASGFYDIGTSPRIPSPWKITNSTSSSSKFLWQSKVIVWS